MKIKDAAVADVGNGMVELSAMVGTERLWYIVPASHAPTELRGDAFAIAGLLPAMRLGIPLEIDSSLPVDPLLLANLERQQHIFALWGPGFRQPLKRVPILARAEAAQSRGKKMSFFSGGVDGTYTLLEAPHVDEAVFVRGVDFQLDNPIYDEAFKRNEAWLAERNIPLISMTSNARWVGKAYGFGWSTYFGGGLSSFAHVLGAGTMYIASGHTWRELWPDGSHPLTDPLWSSSAVNIIHHARDVTRADKIVRIAQQPGALEILRVCWQDKGFNCGECEKCLRTMVLLRLLGLQSPNFPVLSDVSAVAKLVPGDRSEAIFVKEAIALAEEVNDQPLLAALRKSLSKWEWRGILRDTEKAWLGGSVKKLLGRSSPKASADN
ncbi:MAG: hypothetical protein V4628_18190 [Pseudomonadota bacterium]